MTRQDNRNRAAELAKLLQLSRQAEVKYIIELVDNLLNNSKDSLVKADGDDILRHQGGARQLQTLLRMLTEPSPVAAKE